MRTVQKEALEFKRKINRERYRAMLASLVGKLEQCDCCSNPAMRTDESGECVYCDDCVGTLVIEHRVFKDLRHAAVLRRCIRLLESES